MSRRIDGPAGHRLAVDGAGGSARILGPGSFTPGPNLAMEAGGPSSALKEETDR